MKINVLKLTAKGELLMHYIYPDVVQLREMLGGPIDNINLFTDVQTFIRRMPNELEENFFIPGIYGDVVFIGGKGSYLDGLTAQQVTNLIKLYR